MDVLLYTYFCPRGKLLCCIFCFNGLHPLNAKPNLPTDENGLMVAKRNNLKELFSVSETQKFYSEPLSAS